MTSIFSKVFVVEIELDYCGEMVNASVWNVWPTGANLNPPQQSCWLKYTANFRLSAVYQESNKFVYNIFDEKCENLTLTIFIWWLHSKLIYCIKLLNVRLLL